jgi:dephospho-CoA kinase
MTFVLGITGGIGSGKTTATDRFLEHGIIVVDADVIARNIIQPDSAVLKQITDHFGSSVLKKSPTEKKELNREQLRQIVFDNPEEKEWLENLLHPLIRQQITKELNQEQNKPYIILSAPLLLDTDLYTITNRVLVIDCDEELQLTRASNRDSSNQDDIKKIIVRQISRKERLSKADDIITNNGSIDELNQSVDQYHHQLIEQLNRT